MRSTCVHAILVAFLVPLVGIGCNQKKTPSTAENMKARLDAALQITRSSDRDSALTNVATDAADVGFSDIVVQAINGILNTSDRDAAAQDCSHRLAKAGKLPAAKQVASMIISMSTRDEALKDVAKDGH